MKICSGLNQKMNLIWNCFQFQILFSSNAQRAFAISVYHGKYNEFNRVVCVRKKRALLLEKISTLLFIRATHVAVGVIDGRWFEQMRALVLAVCSCGQRARPFNRTIQNSRLLFSSLTIKNFILDKI